MINNTLIQEVLSDLTGKLSPENLLLCENSLRKALSDKKVYFDIDHKKELDNKTALKAFISAKSVEGCSLRTLNYYQTTLSMFFDKITKKYFIVAADDIRSYLSQYQEKNNASKATVDNVRRVISSFFSWLENEDYIAKSPVRRIKKIKVEKRVKETYSDEEIQKMKESVNCKRDLAILDFLFSTGVRVGELVKLNKSEINFESRECIVSGKGNKQRIVYFDAPTKLHLKEYLDSRDDGNEALFVSLQKPHERLKISGVEIMIRKIGKSVGVSRAYPHKFRRTIATKAIAKGMPIEQVQRMLGHSEIDTTLEYAMVDDDNVKISHKKYLE